jgi:hypothetical protein
MVRALTQKPSATILMKDSKKKQLGDVVDTSMPREKECKLENCRLTNFQP